MRVLFGIVCVVIIICKVYDAVSKRLHGVPGDLMIVLFTALGIAVVIGALVLVLERQGR